jgi:hypothetical protein
VYIFPATCGAIISEKGFVQTDCLHRYFCLILDEVLSEDLMGSSKMARALFEISSALVEDC